MPYNEDVGVQHVNKKYAAITMIDFTGQRHNQTVYTSGGDLGTQHEELGELISKASNAHLLEARKMSSRAFKYQDLKFYDEAHATVDKVIVIAFQHDTDPKIKRYIYIPAPDASLLLADGITVDTTNPLFDAVRQKAEDIINDDDNALNPGDFHTYTAWLANHKITNRKSVNLNLPAPIEPDGGDPPDAPGV